MARDLAVPAEELASADRMARCCGDEPDEDEFEKRELRSTRRQSNLGQDVDVD